MSYCIFLAGLMYPVPPNKIETKINNKNTVVTLANEGEVNILKSAGLTNVEFELLLPMVKYSFADYENDFLSANIFMDHLESLKNEKLPFQLDIYREFPNSKGTFYTNLTVSLEDYSITESTENSFDLVANIRLKQYKHFGTKIYSMNEDGVNVTIDRASQKQIVRTVTVKEGDSLWEICKRELGYVDVDVLEAVYQINKKNIDEKNYNTGAEKYMIHKGQTIRLRMQ